MDKKQFICFLLVSLLSTSFALPLWKVFCTQEPLFRGRADPIVDPGILSQHSHKVWGGNNFGIGKTPVDSLQYYNLVRASKCTTCSITLDLSQYWIPDLYYRWPNGSLSLVPTGGLTVYYPSRGGYGAQANPDLKPFPPGLRMTSGSPWRRSFNASKVADRAISYACLGSDGPEVNAFPTDTKLCPNGLRAQVWFPMCWDGVHLDSADHQSHMSFPIQNPDGGDCPSTHPVRLPGVFFEVLFDVNNDKFPHATGTNPFVWANGDSTGYGLHGDFLNGWDTELVAAALADPMCDLAKNPNLAFGNNVTACPPMAPYVKKNNPGGACQMATHVPDIEDLGLGHTVSAMPGCNPITGAQATPVTPCRTAQPAPTIDANVHRVLLKGSNGQYLNIGSKETPLYSNRTGDVSTFTRAEVFLFVPSYVKTWGGYNILSERSEQYLTAPNSGNSPMTANRGNPDDWEVFFATFNGDGTVQIRANSNNKYLSVQADSSVKNNAATAGTTETFYYTDVSSLTLAAPPQQDVPVNAPPPVEVYQPGGSGSSATTTANGAATTTTKSTTTSSSSTKSTSTTAANGGGSTTSSSSTKSTSTSSSSTKSTSTTASSTKTTTGSPSQTTNGGGGATSGGNGGPGTSGNTPDDNTPSTTGGNNPDKDSSAVALGVSLFFVVLSLLSL